MPLVPSSLGPIAPDKNGGIFLGKGRGSSLALSLWTQISWQSWGRHGVISCRDPPKELESTGLEDQGIVHPPPSTPLPRQHSSLHDPQTISHMIPLLHFLSPGTQKESSLAQFQQACKGDGNWSMT